MLGDHSRQTSFILIAFAVLLLMPDAGLPEVGKTGSNSPQTKNAVKGQWSELVQRKPYPYTIPLLAARTGFGG